MIDKDEEQALALIALAAGRTNKKQGQVPSDEELAAFIDNSLSETDKTRVKSHIANNPVTYQRWIQAIDSNLAFCHSANYEETPSTGIFSQLTASIRKIFSLQGAKPLLGSSALAALLIIAIIPKNSQIDMFYDDYPLQQKMYTTPDFQTKSLPFTQKPKLIQAIEYGIYKRITESNMDSTTIGMDIKKLSKTAPTPTVEFTKNDLILAQKAGELALLHDNYCRSKDSQTDKIYYSETRNYTATLLQELSANGLLKKLGVTPSSAPIIKPDQCVFSQMILSAL